MGLSRMLLWAALVDAVLGLSVSILAALLVHRRLRFSILVVGIGVIATVGAGLMQAVVLLEDGFSRLHLAYLVMVVAVPAVGASVGLLWLLSRRVDRLHVTQLAGLASCGLLVFAVVGFWGTHVEPTLLRTDRVSLDVEQVDDRPLRIGVLADLQTREIGDYEWEAVERLNREAPDLVVLPGDFIQGDEARFRRELPELRALLEAIDAPAGVFLVAGDSDSPHRVRTIAEGSTVTALVNEVVRVDVDGTGVWIGGTELQWFSGEAKDTIDELDRAGAAADVRLLVAHRPDIGYLAAERERIDLVAAGHTHGGQVAIPFLGPPLTLSDVPRSVGAGGLGRIEGQPIYVGTGVGMERATAPQVRLFARPSVGLVELR